MTRQRLMLVGWAVAHLRHLRSRCRMFSPAKKQHTRPQKSAFSCQRRVSPHAALCRAPVRACPCRSRRVLRATHRANRPCPPQYQAHLRPRKRRLAKCSGFTRWTRAGLGDRAAHSTARTDSGRSPVSSTSTCSSLHGHNDTIARAPSQQQHNYWTPPLAPGAQLTLMATGRSTSHVCRT